MNLFRYENILLDQNGTPITGANVWVCTGAVTPNFSLTPPAPLATVYSDILGTIPITQPILTSPLGNYAFCMAPGSVATVVFTGTAIQASDIITIPQVANQTVEVDGVQYPTLQAALAALPAAGGTIDMRGNNSASALALGTFDPGARAVTVLLGPFTYTLQQITLRNHFCLKGTGTQTIINATGGNAVPPFVIDQSTATQNIILEHFLMNGTAGNTTQQAFSFIAPSNGGVWYSEMNDIFLQGFGGKNLNFDGQSNGIHQFNTIKRVVATRPLNGDYALQIIGRANSLKFENCEFDGLFNTQDGRTNIFIGQGTATIFPPYNIKFDLLTTQYAGTGFLIRGADGISVDQGHVEAVEQVFNVDTGSSFGSLNITIHDSTFGNATGVGTATPGVGVGQGYIIKNTAATGNASISIITTHIYNTPDAFLTGNTGSIVSFGNLIGPEGSYTFQPFQPGTPNGFGNGSAGTAVTTTTKNTGSGPTTAQTVVSYIKITQSGVVYWVPLMQ